MNIKGIAWLGIVSNDPATEHAMRALVGAGVELRSGVRQWRGAAAWHRWVYFADPAGTVLLLLERRGDPVT